MMIFPEVYSGEMMWDTLKSAVLKAGEEQGYTLRGTQCCDKSTVKTKSATSGQPFPGWTYSLGCYQSRLYQSRQASFLNSGGNEMFEQGNKVTCSITSNSTCVRMLHMMDERLYDVQTVANIFNKTKMGLLEEKVVDTSSTKAQKHIDFLVTNPITNSVIVIHDPSKSLIGKIQKGRPNKK
jgi:hypothetical protein